MKTFLKHSILAALVLAYGWIFTATAGEFFEDVPAPTRPATANEPAKPSPPVTPSPLAKPSPLAVPQKLSDGIVVPLKDTFLKVEVYGDNVVRIAGAKDRAFFARKSVMTEPKRASKTKWSLKTENGEAILSTASLQVRVNLTTGAVSFFDAKGQPILAEKADGRTIIREDVRGEHAAGLHDGPAHLFTSDAN